jgi:AraC-like DNA-binding protein
MLAAPFVRGARAALGPSMHEGLGLASNGRLPRPRARMMLTNGDSSAAPSWASWNASMTIPLARVRYLRAYADAYERLGGDGKRLLREVHLSPELLASVDALVPLRPVMRFIERAAHEVGPMLGSLAAPRRLAELESLGRHLAAAPTLGDAFTRFARAARAEATGSEFTIRRQQGAVWLCRAAFPIENELLLAQVERYVVEAMLLLPRYWLGDSWRPEELWLQSEPWPGDDRFADIPRLRHRAPMLAFPVSVQESLASTAGEPLEPLESFDDAPLDELDLVGSLMKVVEAQLPLGEISLPDMAALVGTSARTLQRRLDAQGTTYSVVLDEVRQRVALERLLHTDATITEIAHDLGYSDSAHFARAFRRWAGISPLELRRLHRG